MNDQRLTEQLPPIRVSPALKFKLLAMIRNRPGKLSDHVRFAVERYVEMEGDDVVIPASPPSPKVFPVSK